MVKNFQKKLPPTKLYIIGAWLVAFFIYNIRAQGQTSVSNPSADTTRTSLVSVWKAGRAGFRLRDAQFATINQGPLTNAVANAVGLGGWYRSGMWHGWRLATSGQLTFAAFTAGVSTPDPLAHRWPRYELELFDVAVPTQRYHLFRLDQLHLHYQSGPWRVRIGRMLFDSPLVNPQDTRMNAYAVQGLSFRYTRPSGSALTMAWFDHFSPRSTAAWYRAGSSIGIYPVGLAPDGLPSRYGRLVKTAGLAVVGITTASTAPLNAQVWAYWLENVAISTYSRIVHPLGPAWRIGVEALRQQRQGQGGGPDSMAYWSGHRATAWLAGITLQHRLPAGRNWSLSYLFTGTNSRVTFPREWGREQFFAAVPRIRMEGTSGAHLLSGRYRLAPATRRWVVEAMGSRAWFPADIARNKYRQASFWQLTLDAAWHSAIYRTNLHVLYVARYSPGTTLPLAARYYMTNFQHFALVADVSF